MDIRNPILLQIASIVDQLVDVFTSSGRVVSCRSKKRDFVAQSSVEAEYVDILV